MDQLQLGLVAKGSDRDIGRHLDGDSCLRVPLLPSAQTIIDERKEAEMPLTKIEWVRELMRHSAEEGNDDIGPDGIDDLIDEANSLVETRATLRDYPAAKVRFETADEDAG